MERDSRNELVIGRDPTRKVRVASLMAGCLHWSCCKDRVIRNEALDDWTRSWLTAPKKAVEVTHVTPDLTEFQLCSSSGE